jgi:hypothetical protein
MNRDGDDEGDSTIDLPVDRLIRLVRLARIVDALDPSRDHGNRSCAGAIASPQPKFVSLAYRQLRSAIEDMSEDERAALVVLVWIGRGDFDVEEVDEAVVAALDWRDASLAHYLMDIQMLSDLLELGASAFGVTFSAGDGATYLGVHAGASE